MLTKFMKTIRLENKKQFLIGLISLIMGIIFYFTFRPDMSSYLQSKFVKIDTLFGNYSNLLGQLGDSLPEFIHPFAFSLLSMGAIANTRKARILICMIFFLINLLFELSQKYAALITIYIPNWFNKLFILENTKNYFIKGTFSILDLIVIFLGSIMAFITSEIIS